MQGSEGLGYYRDKPPTPAASSAKAVAGAAVPAKPKVILGNNSIIKGLAPKAGGVAKRKKQGIAREPVVAAVQHVVAVALPGAGCCSVYSKSTRQIICFVAHTTSGFMCCLDLTLWSPACHAGAEDTEQPAYLREMEAWQKQACSDDDRRRSLVK